MIHEPADINDPCCEECIAWATGADVDEQTRQNVLQDSINAAYERLKAASIGYSLQQGVFVIGRTNECPPRAEGAKPHCPDCAGIVGETGIVW